MRIHLSSSVSGVRVLRASLVAGLLGLAACKGSAGPEGPPGDQGSPGAQGQQGPQGATGETGPQGAAGAQGPQGAAGAQGPQGPGALMVTQAEPAGSNCPHGGVMLQAAVDHNGNGTVDVGEVDPASTKYLCNGADGAQGIQGPAGSTGPQGEPGALALYGDGSAGDLTTFSTDNLRNLIAGYGTLQNGANLMFRNININSVVLVASGVTIRATGDITIGPQGILVVDPERSMQTVNRPTRGLAMSMPEDSQGGRGLDLGRSAVLTRFDLSGGGAGFRPKIANTSVYSGSEGGGRVILAAKGNINLNGLIDANGRNGGIPTGSALAGGGGGGGGVVTLVSRGTITLGTNGAIQAHGGNGANALAGATGQLYGGGGGGGGGIIQILSASQPVIPNQANLNVTGGTAGTAAVTGTATTLAAAGGGGGASGGDGGDGTKSTAASGAAAAGATGDLSVTVTAQPELLFY